MKEYNNPSGSNEQNPKGGGEDPKSAGEDPKRKDPEMQKSGGSQGQNKDREQPNKDNQPGRKDHENVGEGDAEPDLPNKKQPDEKPYIGDNPEETKRQAPKMK